MRKTVFVVAVLGIAAGPALAQDVVVDRPPSDTVVGNPPVPQSSPDGEEVEEGEEMVCRTERVTGSLTRRQRTCMTRNEWARIEARTRDEHSRMVRGASGSQCIPTDVRSGQC